MNWFSAASDPAIGCLKKITFGPEISASLPSSTTSWNEFPSLIKHCVETYNESGIGSSCAVNELIKENKITVIELVIFSNGLPQYGFSESGSVFLIA
jgi:hypothetical protein